MGKNRIIRVNGSAGADGTEGPNGIEPIRIASDIQEHVRAAIQTLGAETMLQANQAFDLTQPEAAFAVGVSMILEGIGALGGVEILTDPTIIEYDTKPVARKIIALLNEEFNHKIEIGF